MNKIMQGRITSGFGERIHPITGEIHFHRGIDIVQEDWNVYSLLTQTVYKVGSGLAEGIYIQNRSIVMGIRVYVNYFHNKLILLKESDIAVQDDVIAKQGATGNTKGAHSHIELFVMDNQKDNKHYNDLLKNLKFWHDDIGDRMFFDPIRAAIFFENWGKK